MGATKIEWATTVWNPVTGCTKVSAGCAHCYAERMVQRFGDKIHGGFKPNPYTDPTPFSRVVCHYDRLDEPFHWRRPRRVFVCSMGDLFHKDVPDSFIDEVLFPVYTLDNHTWMILTKRPERMLAYLSKKTPLGHHAWLGVSVEDQPTADERISLLLQTPAAMRFVSYEPALGPVDLSDWLFCDECRTGPYGPGAIEDLAANAAGGKPWRECRCSQLDWVICGGESGPGARPMQAEWARSVRDQCVSAGVPFFFKQWGEWTPTPADSWHHRRDKSDFHGFDDGTAMYRSGKRRAGRLLDGREWNEYPKE